MLYDLMFILKNIVSPLSLLSVFPCVIECMLIRLFINGVFLY
jgi:hypothetical protein